jgi:hypothetical protein
MSNFQISQLGTSSLSQRCEPKKSLKPQLVAGWEVRSDPIPETDPIRPERYGHRVGAKSGDFRNTHRNFGMEKMSGYHFQKWNVSERSQESMNIMNYLFHVGTRTCSLSSLVALSFSTSLELQDLQAGPVDSGTWATIRSSTTDVWQCISRQIYIYVSIFGSIIVVFNIM